MDLSTQTVSGCGAVELASAVKAVEVTGVVAGAASAADEAIAAACGTMGKTWDELEPMLEGGRRGGAAAEAAAAAAAAVAVVVCPKLAPELERGGGGDVSAESIPRGCTSAMPSGIRPRKRAGTIIWQR